MRQIILDTETTGISHEEGHRIIEIGCVELINRKFTGKHYHQYINPKREMDEGALKVHGITQEFLQDKPLFNDILADFLRFIEGAELIIHNAPFDVGFLNHEFQLVQKAHPPLSQFCRIIDTLVLARQLHVGQRNSLDALCKRYGIDNSDRQLHGALLDANLLAKVYLAMTGGQSSFFDELQLLDPVPQAPIVTESVKEISTRDLMVLLADQEELAAHEMKLNQMAEKKCIWL